MCAAIADVQMNLREMDRAGCKMRFLCHILPRAFASLRNHTCHCALMSVLYIKNRSHFQILSFMPTICFSASLLPLFFFLDLMQGAVSMMLYYTLRKDQLWHNMSILYTVIPEPFCSNHTHVHKHVGSEIFIPMDIYQTVIKSRQLMRILGLFVCAGILITVWMHRCKNVAQIICNPQGVCMVD